MVTASVSRRVWVTLTRVFGAAPTDPSPDTEPPLNRRWTGGDPFHRLVSLIEKIPSSFSEEQFLAPSFSRVHALFTTLHTSAFLLCFPLSSSSTSCVRFLRFSISRRKKYLRFAKENFSSLRRGVEKSFILFKILIENRWETIKDKWTMDICVKIDLRENIYPFQNLNRKLLREINGYLR